MKESILNELPKRDGGRPLTTNTNPHSQLEQQPKDLSFVNELRDWAFQLEFIEQRPSAISVPGALAMCMDEDRKCTDCNAFMIGTEFAHFHPHPDYSLHLGLSTKDAEITIAKGWGEWHPLIEQGYLPPNIIMLYAPRNEEELAAAKIILGRSYDYAKGKIK
ncbi:phospholipase [Flagellimonas sp. DF-77]|uniref:luciferase domain-containing protein n=1 Tax=Flagellimonas algarum TaxID=3230298 RepID=UPI003392DA50